MNYTAAQQFMTQNELFESMRKEATKTQAPSSGAKSNGISIGQVIKVGLTIIIVCYQLWLWYKSMEKILYPKYTENHSFNLKD